MSNKNWLGLDDHPTDAIATGWRAGSVPKQIEDMKRNRANYDLIADLGPQYKAALDALINQSYRCGGDDAQEGSEDC